MVGPLVDPVGTSELTAADCARSLRRLRAGNEDTFCVPRRPLLHAGMLSVRGRVHHDPRSGRGRRAGNVDRRDRRHRSLPRPVVAQDMDVSHPRKPRTYARRARGAHQSVLVARRWAGRRRARGRSSPGGGRAPRQRSARSTVRRPLANLSRADEQGDATVRLHAHDRGRDRVRAGGEKTDAHAAPDDPRWLRESPNRDRQRPCGCRR